VAVQCRWPLPVCGWGRANCGTDSSTDSLTNSTANSGSSYSSAYCSANSSANFSSREQEPCGICGELAALPHLAEGQTVFKGYCELRCQLHMEPWQEQLLHRLPHIHSRANLRQRGSAWSGAAMEGCWRKGVAFLWRSWHGWRLGWRRERLLGVLLRPC